MRTTVNLDDDVLGVAKEMAALSGRTLGEVLSDLVRQALTRGADEPPVRNGVPVLEPTPEARMVSSEDVARLLDDE
jgi:hypothetical protein